MNNFFKNNIRATTLMNKKNKFSIQDVKCYWESHFLYMRTVMKIEIYVAKEVFKLMGFIQE